MQELKAEKPPESPEGVDCVVRLMQRLREEGFSSDVSPDEGWQDHFEVIYQRDEKISFASGETVVIFTKIPELNERILRQTSESVVNLYRAKKPIDKNQGFLNVRSGRGFPCGDVRRSLPQTRQVYSRSRRPDW